MRSIKVLIVDDHALLREGIRALLCLQNDMEIVGEANDGKEAVRKVEELNPDVIVMDVSMPSMGGAEATRQIVKRKPDASVVSLNSLYNNCRVKDIAR